MPQDPVTRKSEPFSILCFLISILGKNHQPALSSDKAISGKDVMEIIDDVSHFFYNFREVIEFLTNALMYILKINFRVIFFKKVFNISDQTMAINTVEDLPY